MSEDLELAVIEYYLAPHTLQDTAQQILGQKCTKAVTKILKKYNIKKHSKEVTQKMIEATNIRKYGTKSPSSAAEVKEKRQNTVQKRYGTLNVFQVDEIKRKSKLTCINKYGVDHYNKTKESEERRKQTCMQHFGVDVPLKNLEIQEKMKQTNLKKYGVENYTQTAEYKKICHEKQALTSEKQRQTKAKNRTFNVSKIEKNYKIYLENKYGINNVLSQYYDERYPFACDFYIKSLDLFIELNLTWTHGGHAFMSDITDLDKLHLWEQKAMSSRYYKNAIYTWTDLDVRKKEIAKINNLNYLCIYNKQDLYKIL